MPIVLLYFPSEQSELTLNVAAVSAADAIKESSDDPFIQSLSLIYVIVLSLLILAYIPCKRVS